MEGLKAGESRAAGRSSDFPGDSLEVQQWRRRARPGHPQLTPSSPHLCLEYSCLLVSLTGISEQRNKNCVCVCGGGQEVEGESFLMLVRKCCREEDRVTV